MDRDFMAHVRTAVWAKGEDFEQMMEPIVEVDEEAELAESLAAFGLKLAD